MKQTWHWFALSILILLFVALKSYPEELEIISELTLGYSTEFENPFVDIHLGAGAYGFKVYGGTHIDIQQAAPGKLSFGPLRSVYDIGCKFNWRFVELGWYHQCTHRGDYATYEQWYQMRKPNEDDYYVKFSFTR